MTAGSRRERKVITAVFADLVGFTARSERLDPEDVEAFLQPYHELLKAEFERFGGTVEKFIGDAVVAVFGAPITHEDDPERAVRSALAIRDRIRERGELELRIGVNTGEAIVRLDARPGAGEGSATGDVLNTAARLQAAAQANGILVGEATYSLTRDAIRYEPVDPIQAKGKAEPVPAWEAIEALSRLGVDVRQQSRLPLVGRERERSILIDALARVEAERSPQLVTIIGEPGIGKSRLVYELFVTLEARDELRTWRQGRSLPYGEGVSFWALGEMVKAQAGILDGDEPPTATEKLERSVREVISESEAEWVVGWLRPLVGLQGEPVGGQERRNESFTAWRRFWEELAERRSLVLVFEDLHWADEGLLDFIEHLVDWAADVPMLVVCTTRPELLDRRPGWAGGKRNALTLALSGLSDVESARLLAAVMDRSVLLAETQQTLLERASGNPLYAEQFARLYLERGSAKELPLPDNVQGLIAARLDTLSPPEKALLHDAAVMGKVFWSGALTEGEGSSELLHALGRKEFVRRERRSSVAGQDEYAFRHVLVRDVAYGQIPRADRAAKHLRAAAWIDALGQSPGHAELMAHHYAAAMELSPTGLPSDALERARRAFSDAGDRTHDLSAFASALGYYRSALSLMAQNDPARPQLLFKIGRDEYHAHGAGHDELVEAATGLAAAGHREAAAEAETLLVTIGWESGHRGSWWGHMERAMEMVSDLPPTPAKAKVLTMRARYLYLAGDPTAAMEAGREALAMTEVLRLEELRANALNTVGMALLHRGDDQGFHLLRQSIGLTDALNSVDSFRGYNNLSVWLGLDGRLEEAREARAESGRAAQRFGSASNLRWYRSELVAADFDRGDWDRAIRDADSLIAEAERGSPHYMETTVRTSRAMMRAARGDLDGALTDARRGLELGRAAQDPQALQPGLAIMIYVRAERGEHDAAHELLDELTGVRGGLGAFGAPIHVVWAATALGRGEELLEPFRHERVTPWLTAAHAVVDGDWMTAVEIYARMGTVPNESLARLRAAESLMRAGRRGEADVQLRLASDAFRRLGATRFLHQATALVAWTA